MPNEVPVNDPQTVWKNQPTEAFRMSADELRRRALRLERKARLAALRDMIAGLIMFAFFGWAFVRFPEGVQSLGFGPISLWSIRLGLATLSLWSIRLAYRTFNSLRVARLLPAATLDTTLRAYRGQLEKHRDYERRVWLTIIPALLGMAMVVAPYLIQDIAIPRLLVNVVPIFVLLAIWLAIFLPVRTRRRRNVQREIEQLRTFELEYTA